MGRCVAIEVGPTSPEGVLGSEFFTISIAGTGSAESGSAEVFFGSAPSSTVAAETGVSTVAAGYASGRSGLRD